MLEKFKCNYNNNTFWKEDLSDKQKNKLLIIISVDRAEHQSTEKGRANFIRFNLIIKNKKLLNLDYTSI